MNIMRLFLCFALLLSFAACSSSSEEKEEAAKEEARKEEKAEEAKRAVDTYKQHLICPQVAVIRELETVRDFGNEKQDAGQLVAAARMQSVEGTCAYQDNGIDITFTIDFTAVRGPRLGGERAAFPFFIGIIGPAGAIVTKDQMSETFTFKSDDKTTTREEPLHVFIPLAKEQKSTGPNYRVLVGFQLNEEQLKEVRREEALKK